MFVTYKIVHFENFVPQICVYYGTNEQWHLEGSFDNKPDNIWEVHGQQKHYFITWFRFHNLCSIFFKMEVISRASSWYFAVSSSRLWSYWSINLLMESRQSGTPGSGSLLPGAKSFNLSEICVWVGSADERNSFSSIILVVRVSVAW